MSKPHKDDLLTLPAGPLNDLVTQIKEARQGNAGLATVMVELGTMENAWLDLKNQSGLPGPPPAGTGLAMLLGALARNSGERQVMLVAGDDTRFRLRTTIGPLARECTNKDCTIKKFENSGKKAQTDGNCCTKRSCDALALSIARMVQDDRLGFQADAGELVYYANPPPGFQLFVTCPAP